jgi:alpha-tubulin suppressor-like RCC1 family protein
VAIGTGDHTCAVDVAGAMRCWGANGAGQLGDGTLDDRRAPAAVLPLP